VITDPIDLAYVNDLYAVSEDPWHMRSGWYAERKRDLVLASLPNARYGRAFQPGCSTGQLTLGLARRSDQVLAVDSDRDAVTATRSRTSHLSNVEVERRTLPREWPSAQFDLVVLHELGPRFTSSDWADLATAVLATLSNDATVLACHGREDSAEQTLEIETLHGLLDSILGLPRQTRIRDADFTITVWTTRSRADAAGRA
jgi:SAM-dependent methyltransferase